MPDRPLQVRLEERRRPGSRTFPYARKRDVLLLAVLYLGLAMIVGRTHSERVDGPAIHEKLKMHALTLENRAPNPYQYKFFAIEWALEGLHRVTGLSISRLYQANTYLSLLALLLAHHAWIATLYGHRSAVLGTLIMTTTAHVMFLDYYHHPYEFWGVAGFCLLLAAVERGRSTLVLSGLALACGFVWEKHALVAVLWAWRRFREGWRLIPAAARGLVVLACSLAWPVAVRFLCGTVRSYAPGLELERQRWVRIPLNHFPLLLPPLVVLVLRWRDVPPWVRLLWLYVPIMFGVYLARHGILYELRSFWAFVPIYTATICAWLRWSETDPRGEGTSGEAIAQT